MHDPPLILLSMIVQANLGINRLFHQIFQRKGFSLLKTEQAAEIHRLLLAVNGIRDDGLRCVPRQFLIHHVVRTTSPQPSSQALLRGLGRET